MTPEARGAMLLDDNYIEWYAEDEINLDLLDIGISELCILGQLYGDYFAGLDVLFYYVPEDEREALGVSYGFEGSQAEWERLIMKRREGK